MSQQLIPNHIIPNILNEEDIDMVIDEIVYDIHFQKSDTETETCESLGELKFSQEYDDGCIIILDDLNEKKRTILVFKQCSNAVVTITYLFSFSAKITMNYQKNNSC